MKKKLPLGTIKYSLNLDYVQFIVLGAVCLTNGMKLKRNVVLVQSENCNSCSNDDDDAFPL